MSTEFFLQCEQNSVKNVSCKSSLLQLLFLNGVIIKYLITKMFYEFLNVLCFIYVLFFLFQVMIVVLAFVVGLFFMLLYYRLFHTSKISSAFQRSSDSTENGSSGTNGQNRNGKSQNISEKVCEVHVVFNPDSYLSNSSKSISNFHLILGLLEE